MSSAFGREIVELQKNICRKYASDFSTPDPNLKIGIALETIGNQPTRGVRRQPSDGTAGWFIYCGEYSAEPDFYKPVHVAHVSEIIPQVLPYLALSPGFNFIIDNEGYEDVWHEGAAR